MPDKQTTLEDHEEKPVGDKFDRQKVRRLLHEDRDKLKQIQPEEETGYFLGAINSYRGMFYRCLENAGYSPRLERHPSIDEMRGTSLDEFLNIAKNVPTGRFPKCSRFLRRIRLLNERKNEMDTLIDTTIIQGRNLSDRELLDHSIELMDSEITYLRELISDFEYVFGTRRAMQRATQARKIQDRAKTKKEQLKEMLPPPVIIFEKRTVIALYIIIEEKREGKRYRRPGDYSIKRKYPSGRFQSIFDLTAIYERKPKTGKEELIKFKGLDKAKDDFLQELADDFRGVGTGTGVAQADYVKYDKGDITVGMVNMQPETEKDQPPYKRAIGRMVDESSVKSTSGMNPNRDWQYKIEQFI